MGTVPRARTTLWPESTPFAVQAIPAVARTWPDSQSSLPRLEPSANSRCAVAAKHVAATRQLLRKLLIGRITFSPTPSQGVIRW